MSNPNWNIEEKDVCLITIEGRGYTKEEAIKNAKKALVEISRKDVYCVGSRSIDGLLTESADFEKNLSGKK